MEVLSGPGDSILAVDDMVATLPVSQNAFPGTLILSAELYYNGAGTSNPQDYDFAALLARRIQNVGRRYVGFFAGYEITPLLKWSNYFVHNLDDRSHYFSTVLTY